MSWSVHRVFPILVLALWACAAHAAASRPYEADRPGSGFFDRLGGPDRDTAAGQIAYASDLEQQGRLKKAAKAYRALVGRWPDDPLAAEAQFRYARVLEERGKREKAFEAYQQLIDTYPAGFPYAYTEVLDRQFEIAMYMKEKRYGKFLIFPGFDSPDRALPLLEQLVDNAPRRKEAWERGPEAAFLLGALHEDLGDYELAAAAYLDALVRYPESAFAQKAAFRRAQCLVKISDKTPYDRSAAEQAYHALSLFNSSYPGSDQEQTVGESMRKMYDRLALGDFEVAQFYDRHTEKPEAALAAYESFVERFPSSEWTPEARERIKALSDIVEEKRAD